MKAENFVDLEPAIVLRIRFKFYARKEWIGLIEEAMRRKMNYVVVSGRLLEPGLGRIRTNDRGPMASKGGGDRSHLTGCKSQLGNRWRQREEVVAQQLRPR